jgi:NAD(P)-dependent dehydrogenase (short-subunit alcohol dehydrogenase family)
LITDPRPERGMPSPTRYALVTGAAHGIGLEVSRQLAAQGFSVFLTARTLARATDAATSLGSLGAQMRPMALDVTDSGSVSALADALDHDPGRLDVLVNNAAVVADWNETTSSADLGAVHDVLETNLFGAWRVTQALLPLLRQGMAPRIVNVASGAGSHGDPRFGLATGKGVASYGISKAALLALTTKLAIELRDEGVLVNAVCPGLTATAPGMEAMGARPVADGAASVMWAATLGDDGPTGGFFRDGQALPW